MQLRLNAEQRQQREAAEAAVADLEEQAALEADPDVKAGLEEQIAAGKASLDDLMEAFAVRASMLSAYIIGRPCALSLSAPASPSLSYCFGPFSALFAESAMPTSSGDHFCAEIDTGGSGEGRGAATKRAPRCTGTHHMDAIRVVGCPPPLRICGC